MADDEHDVVRVGDQIRFSVELILAFADAVDQCSDLVELRAVRLEADGSKTLLLDRVRDTRRG